MVFNYIRKVWDNMKCLVLAAGYATRLYPLTENFPKPLLQVGNKTILDWLLDDIDKTKRINEYIIVSNHKFIEYFKEWVEKKKLYSPITLIDDGSMCNEERLGAVKDIELAISKLKIDEEMVVMAGDNLLDFSLAKFIKYYDSKNSTCIMRYYEENKEKIKKSASVRVDEMEKVINMEEKPKDPEDNWCSPPFYIYSEDAVRMVNVALNSGCMKDSPGSFIAYIYDKLPVYAMEMPGHRYDIGSIESYEYVKEKVYNKGLLPKE